MSQIKQQEAMVVREVEDGGDDDGDEDVRNRLTQYNDYNDTLPPGAARVQAVLRADPTGSRSLTASQTVRVAGSKAGAQTKSGVTDAPDAMTTTKKKKSLPKLKFGSMFAVAGRTQSGGTSGAKKKKNSYPSRTPWKKQK